MGKKNPTKIAAKASPSKKARGPEVPSVSAMTSTSSGGGPKLRLIDESLHMGVYQYMQKGFLYSDTFKDGRLWVGQMATALMPSPLFQIMKLIKRYGDSEPDSEDPAPCDMDEVTTRYGASLQFVTRSTKDPDEIRWAKNRMGFYVDEPMIKDFLMYFDDLMAFRLRLDDEEFDKMTGTLKIVIHVSDSSPIKHKFDKKEDELKCDFEVVEDSVAMMSVFDLPPPVFPARIVTLSFEMVSEQKAHLIFGGNTKPFQGGFAERKIELCSTKQDPADQYPEYFRVIKDMDLSQSQTCTQKLQEVFEACLKSSPIVLRMKPSKFDHTVVKKIVDPLQTVERYMRVEF